MGSTSVQLSKILIYRFGAQLSALYLAVQVIAGHLRSERTTDPDGRKSGSHPSTAPHLYFLLLPGTGMASLNSDLSCRKSWRPNLWTLGTSPPKGKWPV